MGPFGAGVQQAARSCRRPAEQGVTMPSDDQRKRMKLAAITESRICKLARRLERTVGGRITGLKISRDKDGAIRRVRFTIPVV